MNESYFGLYIQDTNHAAIKPPNVEVIGNQSIHELTRTNKTKIIALIYLLNTPQLPRKFLFCYFSETFFPDMLTEISTVLLKIEYTSL